MYKKPFIYLTLLFILIITIPFSVYGNSQEEENLYPITLIDDLDSEVTLIKKPERIVSAAPSNTEIIFALGLQEKLVGRSDFCNYPPELNLSE